MKVTYLGTTVLLFDDGKDQILFDCHLTRPSIGRLLLSTIQTDETICRKMIEDFKMNHVTAMFISHSHHDHVMDMPYFANQLNCEVYGTSSTLNVGRGGKIAEEKMHEFETLKPVQIGKFVITVIPSRHSPAKWYNNDLGQTIDEPLIQPAKKSAYKEGGSYDFLVQHEDKNYLIRPSFNYVENQLDGIEADVLFMGVGGITKCDDAMREQFFLQTVAKVKPSIVIPVHWDNFFIPVTSKNLAMPKLMEDTKEVLAIAQEMCSRAKAKYILQMPLTTLDI